MKYLENDEKHADACHARWRKRMNRNLNAPGRPDRWCDEECLGCAYYIILSGVFAEDYGVCSNPASKFDQRAMFEHDGCEDFVRADEA